MSGVSACTKKVCKQSVKTGDKTLPKKALSERDNWKKQEDVRGQDHTNDAGAGGESEEGRAEAMLQLYGRPLSAAGRVRPVSVSAADHALADLPLVSRSGAAGRKRITSGVGEKR